MSTLDVARWLVEQRGLSVIPADHPQATTETDPKRIGKIPALARWKPYQERRPTKQELEQWFGNGVPRNLAIITGALSGIVVIDPDDDDAETWATDHLPPTPMMTRTSRGTHHRFYQHPGAPVGNKARIETADRRLKLDIRGDGGYVIGPTSLHASGKVYARVGDWPPVRELPVFVPAWIGTPARGRPKAPIPSPVAPDAHQTLKSVSDLRARGAAYLQAMGPAIEGQGGDQHTYRAAAFLVRDLGLDDATALDLLEDWNRGNAPPWTARELEAKVRHARTYGSHAEGEAARDRRGPDRPLSDPPPSTPYACTDLGNAEYFTARVQEQVCYDFRQGAWRRWTGVHWALDDEGVIWRLVKEAMRARKAEALARPPEAREALLKWALGSENRGRLDNALVLARSEAPLAQAGTHWDTDPWLLACTNGVVDLRTGQLRPARRVDRLTQQTGIAFDPEAPCPRWRQFLTEIFAGEETLIDFVQLALGYSLTGCTDEQVLFVCYGHGANGKTTLLETLKGVLGTYAHITPFSTLELDSRAQIPADLAALAGKRFVLASENNEATRLNEARVKALTGGDTVSACFKFHDYFSFTPICKLWLAVNHRPVVRDTSHGFWRRVRLIPFTQTFPLSKTLRPALAAEAPGILRWAVTGTLAWQALGELPTPPQVLAATESYQEESDSLADFIHDAIELDPVAQVASRDLYDAYRTWAHRNGIEERSREYLSRKTFGHRMGERYRKGFSGDDRVRTYFGIALRVDVGIKS